MVENFHNLNPLDYYVWIVVEKADNEHPLDTKDSLKAAIIRVMSNMNQDHLIPACRRFKSRREIIIEAESDFIE